MRIKEIPDWENGYILKRSMLVSLSDAAILTNELLRKGYANGILSGCELAVTDDTIVVNPGLFFFEGQIFMLKKNLSVKYSPANVTMVLKLCFSDEVRDADCIYREAELRLTEQTALQAGELELCRFKLQEGAKLRCQYQDFEDMNTEYDTLNIIYASQAARGESTLLPEITKTFAREMLKYEEVSEFDALFCLQILGQSDAITKEALISYIEYKTKSQLDSHSNIAVYRALLTILRQQAGTIEKTERKEKKVWKMTLE